MRKSEVIRASSVEDIVLQDKQFEGVQSNVAILNSAPKLSKRKKKGADKSLKKDSKAIGLHEVVEAANQEELGGGISQLLSPKSQEKESGKNSAKSLSGNALLFAQGVPIAISSPYKNVEVIDVQTGILDHPLHPMSIYPYFEELY
jgi:hypothetical protein